MTFKRTAGIASGVSLVIALAGCVDLSGSDDSGGNESSQTITGTAAQGAPLVNAPVLVRCAGDGSEQSVTTDDSGAFEVTGLSASSFPCGLKASIPDSQSQEAFFGAAQESGMANVTPYTDMVLSTASDMSVNKWFDDLQSDGFRVDQTRIDDAVEKINSELEKLGLDVGTTNPMTADFEIGDDYDRTMDRFMAGLENEGSISNFRELSDLLKDGNQNLSDEISNVPDSIPEKGTLAECWNEKLFTPGHSRSLEVETSNQGVVTKTVNVADEGGGKTSVSQQTGSILSSEQIYTVDLIAKKTTLMSSSVGGQKTEFSPGLPTDYAMAQGQSETYEYTVKTSGSQSDYKHTRTFEGIETIDLPNMSGVEACRVENDSTNVSNSTTNVSTNWYAVDNGILLRNQVEGQVKEEFVGSSLSTY